MAYVCDDGTSTEPTLCSYNDLKIKSHHPMRRHCHTPPTFMQAAAVTANVDEKNSQFDIGPNKSPSIIFGQNEVGIKATLSLSGRGVCREMWCHGRTSDALLRAGAANRRRRSSAASSVNCNCNLKGKITGN